MKEDNQDFDFIRINVASPDRIRQWGERVLSNGQIVGEVTKPETINYRTFKPEIDGLFCERIFGPIKSWECHCGKYKQVRDQGLVCELCGVELTESKVRRHRMGYIDLLIPVTHIWYLRSTPSYIAQVLNKKLIDVENIVYFTNSDSNTGLDLTTDELFLKDDDFVFSPIGQESGAEIILNELKEINLNQEIEDCREQLSICTSEIQSKQLTRRIRILENFVSTNARPEWMVLKILPIIPPGLRPMVQLDGGRFATSDLNELYRRVITRNNRLSRLISIFAPDIVLKSEKRMLQEAVDGLIDNGKKGLKTVDMNNRALKSLADTIEGKQGRFRQNLLGKRVDYSGRSVIIVGPELELHQCGLPYELAIELYQPFIIHQLIDQKLAETIRMAKKIIQQNDIFIWRLLRKVMKGHPILLNRAPTLHRLGIQAFEPKLVNGRAILLHPLVCPAFNADFDGDQMAVHLPLSLEAQIEARILMLGPNNFLSPATGDPIIQPTQDMLLGCYYLTVSNMSALRGADHYFSNFEDAIFAYEQNQIDLHAPIWVRNNLNSGFEISSTETAPSEFINKINLADKTKLEIFRTVQQRISANNEVLTQYIRTTVGRILFNTIFSKIISF